ncbi:hypothetical protein BDQ12DRAFT_613687, partial [Crucibulum laeve]
DDQILQGYEILGPFKSKDEWELAKWLIKNVGHTQMEEFLHLPIIQKKVDPAYPTKDKLLNAIDALPQGVDWKLENITLTGDVLDEEGNAMKEELELWYHDPVECIHELMGNPIFANVMKYTPEKVFETNSCESQIINEMWTVEWWWKVQVSL